MKKIEVDEAPAGALTDVLTLAGKTLNNPIFGGLFAASYDKSRKSVCVGLYNGYNAEFSETLRTLDGGTRISCLEVRMVYAAEGELQPISHEPPELVTDNIPVALHFGLGEIMSREVLLAISE